MTLQQLQVRDFMLHVGQECPQTPQEPPHKTKLLRFELIREELDELREALGLDTEDYNYQDCAGTFNLVEVADGLGDLLVVVLGTAIACGIDLEPIFSEIHRSNMSKLPDGSLRADGKWIKGPSYSPANLQPILEAQSIVLESEQDAGSCQHNWISIEDGSYCTICGGKDPF